MKISTISVGDGVIDTANNTVVHFLQITEGNAKFQIENSESKMLVLPHSSLQTSSSFYGPQGSVDSRIKKPCWVFQSWLGNAKFILQNGERRKEKKWRANDFPFRGHDPGVSRIPLDNSHMVTCDVRQAGKCSLQGSHVPCY